MIHSAGQFSPFPLRPAVFTHLRSPRGSHPQLAGEGGAIGRRKTPVFRRAMAPDGVWPTATTPDGLHERYRELAVQAPCFTHPIRRLRRHLPRFAEKGL